METITDSAICVLTARGVKSIMEEGGSQAWVLDAKRSRKHKYVVCIQNRGPAENGNDWGAVTAPHHDVFLVGRLKDVIPALDQEGGEGGNRWLLRFSEYAEVTTCHNAWPGHRNPVFYTNLSALGIDIKTLKFKPMPEPKLIDLPKKVVKPLTMVEAKEGLALTFGVAPSDIEIVVRG